uniref:Ubiquitin thioesterase n=1 Tax=Caenorhabditis tropicalis TaxID=1561998 RepID=A0A1I7U878_9PELO
MLQTDMVHGSSENQTTSTEAITEDEILLQDQQLKRIEDEQKSAPLVGDKCSLFSLVALYDPDTSSAFFSKANELTEVYSDIRFIRGDGNCFYRAVLVGLVEIMLADKEKLRKFITSSKEWTEKLVKLGFPDWTCTDFCEFFIEFLQNIYDGKDNADAVFKNLNDDNTANYLLMFFRLITSGHLKENAAHYEPFIGEGLTLAQYCETEIEAMWKESDHLAIIALVKATNIRLRIEYMDRSEAPNGGWHHNLPDGNDDASFVPDITLLYRPGHYDLIYKKPAVAS